MRLGGDQIGRWGLSLLAVTGIIGVVLAFHCWAGRGSAIVPVAAPAASQPARSAPAPSASASSSPAASSSASPSASVGPLLSSEPYANQAFQVWPGTLSAAAKQALTGLTVSVHRQGTGVSVTAGVNGQATPAPRLYPTGARVYVVEASMGDDSGNSDYNLGDDGLIVTDAAGRVVG
jgi:hypothetical protein